MYNRWQYKKEDLGTFKSSHLSNANKTVFILKSFKKIRSRRLTVYRVIGPVAFTF